MSAIIISNWVVPNLMWAYQVQQTLPLLYPTLRWPTTFNPIAPEISDSFPTLKTTAQDAALEVALNHLSSAAKWQANHATAYYLMGQIYSARRAWTNAQQAFQAAYNVAQRNPRFAWRAALAAEQRVIPAAQIMPLYEAAGFNADSFLKNGDLLTRSFQFVQAGQYYKRAALLDAQAKLDQPTFAARFRQGIAKLRMGDPAAVNELATVHQLDPTFQVAELADQRQVAGAQLRLVTAVNPPTITFGIALSNPSGSIGMLWWTSQAVAVISVTHAATYQLSLNLLHSSPPPIEFAIGADGLPMAHLTLDRGDNTWQTFTYPVKLAKGMHTIDLWYLNNAVVAGKDRDAAVNWLMLTASQLGPPQ